MKPLQIYEHLYHLQRTRISLIIGAAIFHNCWNGGLRDFDIDFKRERADKNSNFRLMRNLNLRGKLTFKGASEKIFCNENLVFHYIRIFLFGFKNKNWNYWSKTPCIFLTGWNFLGWKIKNNLKAIWRSLKIFKS